MKLEIENGVFKCCKDEEKKKEWEVFIERCKKEKEHEDSNNRR